LLDLNKMNPGDSAAVTIGAADRLSANAGGST